MGFKFSVPKCIYAKFLIFISLFKASQYISKILYSSWVCILTADSAGKYIILLIICLFGKVKETNVLKYLSGTSWEADRTSLLMTFKSLILFHLDYGSPVYESASEAALRCLDVLQNACWRICLRALRCTRLARM